jgi:hypothetical protein
VVCPHPPTVKFHHSPPRPTQSQNGIPSGHFPSFSGRGGGGIPSPSSASAALLYSTVEVLILARNKLALRHRRLCRTNE